jgi:hypothetical protein
MVLARGRGHAQAERVWFGLAKHPLMLSLSKHTRTACLSALLAACSGGGGGSAAPTSDSPNPSATMSGTRGVSCAIGGAQAFTNSCTVEQAQVEGAPILVVRHADGGFRRFALKDGTLAEADGAEQAVVSRSGTTIDVTVGADRYRLDASLLPDGQ